jgi:hypothetical protein
MVQQMVNYFWAHPVALSAAAIGVLIVLIWMTGSGSRQRFMILRRTSQTDQIARDLSRIAGALERLAKAQETPTDFVGRPIPEDFNEVIITNHVGAHAEGDHAAPQAAPAADAPEESSDTAVAAAAAASASNLSTAHRPAAPAAAPNPLGGTADLLGKKKLDLPNPLYRPK